MNGQEQYNSEFIYNNKKGSFINLKVFILALSTVAVGLVELIIGGILRTIADDLNVSHASAGQLITAFALTYAIAGPVLLVMTSKIERKKLYLVSLLIFKLGL